MAKSFREWIKNERHLPRPLRDFHAQKDLFKKIWSLVAESRARDPNSVMALTGEFNWIMAHCFVVDRFLHFMACHGYTLQRVRKQPFEFDDLAETLADFRRKESEALGKMMGWTKEPPDAAPPE